MGCSQFPVILTYHSISDGDSPLKISPGLFTEQMEWLHRHARVAPLAEVVSALLAHKSLPERAVVLTFDDGFRDFYSSAAPVLRRLHLPATIFLPTGYCGRTNSWPGQLNWVTEEAMLDWAQVKELSGEGFSFGGHSVNHPALTSLPSEDAEREIVTSRDEIQEHTQHPVEFFAYPYGRWSQTIRNIVLKHYRGACATGAGVVEPDADPFALPRADAHYVRWPALFKTLFTTPFVAYLGARRLIRLIRREPEGLYARV